MQRQHSLYKKKEIDEVFNKKLVKGTANFVLYKSDVEKTKLHLLISIGKKYGNAVERNKMKRRIREIIRSMKDRILPHDIIIVVKPISKKLLFEEIKKDVSYLLKKLELLKEKINENKS